MSSKAGGGGSLRSQPMSKIGKTANITLQNRLGLFVFDMASSINDCRDHGVFTAAWFASLNGSPPARIAMAFFTARQ
jgi:hypothetical protein